MHELTSLCTGDTLNVQTFSDGAVGGARGFGDFPRLMA
jgi:hypothetical protein